MTNVKVIITFITVFYTGFAPYPDRSIEKTKDTSLCHPEARGIWNLEKNSREKAGCYNMPNKIATVQVWLSPFLPQEEKVANYPPLADARDDDSSTAA